MVDFDTITRIEHMISYDDFPVIGGEADLNQLPTVFDHLEARIRREIADPVDVILWADSPDYASRGDLIVTVDWDAADLSEYHGDRALYLMDLTGALYDELPQWLQEAQEAAGVEFGRALCTECGEIFDVGDMVQAWGEVNDGEGTCLECAKTTEEAKS